MMIFTMLMIIRAGSEVKEVRHEPLREAVQHVEHALPVEQGGEKTTDGEDPAYQHFKTLSLFPTPGDEEVLLPASLLGDQVDVPVEHGHKNTHLRKCNFAKRILQNHKTDHEATDEADKANIHAVLAQQALRKSPY